MKQKPRFPLHRILTAIFFLVLPILLLRLAAPVLAQGTPGDAIGGIDVPPGVAEINTASGLPADQIAVFYFLSRMIRIAAIAAGIWSFLNVMLAGWTYITSGGNAQAHTKARDLITMSLLGMLLIGSIYTVAGVFGFIFFGDAGFILNPTI